MDWMKMKQDNIQAMFVPMDSKNKHPDGKPAHPLKVITRGDLLYDWFNDSISTGNFGAVYKAYPYAVLSFIAILLTYTYSIYLAAVFAYLAGFFWSRTLILYAWSVEWFKGKALVYSK
ncbi:MAG: hypothetical protein ABH803_00735 [Candidatus Micrarchaeota archaeon]